MAFAKIDKINGTPVVTVDGEPLGPMSITTRIMDDEYIKEIRKTGIRLFFVFANTDWMRPGKTVSEAKDWSEVSGFNAFKAEAEHLLQLVPDAYIMIRVGMHPPVSWMEEHPDDLLRYDNGKTKPCIINSEVHLDNVPGCYSLCSENWRKDGEKALEEFCRQVDETDFANRVIGYFIAAGGTSEWYYVNRLSEPAEGTVADISPAFKKEYSHILKEKYLNNENLKRSWKLENADIDNPVIPSLAEREYVDIDKAIVHSLVTFECADRIESDIHYGKAPNRNGIFLNVNNYRYVHDFFDAWHEGTANTIIHFANVLKKRYDGKLVGAFYGSLGCNDYFDMANATSTLKILDSGVVDFLAAPGVYNNREPGGYVAQREVQDSFLLRNMIFVSEDDSRTHLDCDFYRDANLLFDSKDSVKTLKRDFARNLCENNFGWWFDQFEQGGRFKHEEIYKMFSRQQEIADAQIRNGLKKANEIAIIYDEESIHLVSRYTDSYMLDFYRTSDLARIGAGVDYYFHNDLSRDDMPDYKMYIMLNTFCLSDSEREEIKKKASKNNAVVLWMYAPGFVNFDRELPMDNNNIKNITGMNVERTDDTHSVKFYISNPSHPAVKYADADKKYGWIDRNVCSNVWVGSVLEVPFLNPCFSIIEDDDTTVLGRYCIDDKPAYALKKENGYTSVYCATQILRAELITSLAEYAGCHIYNYQDDCIYANENFVNIHAKFSGKHKIYFKKACTPYEIYEKKEYGKNVTEIEIDMKMGDTLTFSVNDNIR